MKNILNILRIFLSSKIRLSSHYLFPSILITFHHTILYRVLNPSHQCFITCRNQSLDMHCKSNNWALSQIQRWSELVNELAFFSPYFWSHAQRFFLDHKTNWMYISTDVKLFPSLSETLRPTPHENLFFSLRSAPVPPVKETFDIHFLSFKTIWSLNSDPCWILSQ